MVVPKEASLSDLFDSGLRIVESADNLAGPSGHGTTQEGIAALRAAEALVERGALFSRNEELDDVATGDLRYLLTPHLLAELAARTPERDPEARAAALQEALAAYQRFAEGCETYGIEMPEALRAPEGGNAAEIRAHKIARFRWEKEARARVEAARKHAGRASGEDDSEEAREAWLLRLRLALVRSVDVQALLLQELEVLLHSAALSPQEQDAAREAREAEAAASDELLAKLRLASSQLAGPSREQMAAQALRPFHRPPTVSLRAQADAEVAEAQARAALQAERDRERTRVGARDELEDKAALAKQRRWDDWKDEHPFGEGNSKLRPTA